MSLFERLLGSSKPPPRTEPRFVRASGEGQLFDNLTDGRLAEYLRGGSETQSGAVVTERVSLCQAVSWRCASIITGVVRTLPCDLMMREDENTRAPAVKNPFRDVLTVRPNNRQTPGEFKTMLQLHKLQRGNGYALKIRSRGRIIALWPLDPARMHVVSHADNSLTYRYATLQGGTTDYDAADILHLRGLSWDGVTGLSVISYMAEAVGLSTQTHKAAAKLFRNGQFRSGVMESPNALSDKAYERLKKDRDEQAGIDADDAQKWLILEEGLEFAATSLTAVESQLIELLGFTRDDIGMFYGVPPHLYGDTTKATSWGSGIEQQNLGFLTYTIQDHLTSWSETLKRDCLSESGDDPRLYVHFDLKGFLRADSAARSAYLSRALGSGGGRPWLTQNEARAAEEYPPSDEPWASVLPEIGNTRITETITDPNAPPADAADGGNAGPKP
jgi:HK97 family phage portal protein